MYERPSRRRIPMPSTIHHRSSDRQPQAGRPRPESACAAVQPNLWLPFLLMFLWALLTPGPIDRERVLLLLTLLRFLQEAVARGAGRRQS